MSRHLHSTWLIIGCILFTLLLIPDSPRALNWVKVILLLASLVLIPLWLDGQYAIRKIQLLLSAWSLGFGFLLPQGVWAGVLALPWLISTLWLAYTYLLKQHRPSITPITWSGRAAFLYLSIGAAWAVADRLGWQPLGFQSTIVLLTAVHFHYAGFLLLGIADRLIRFTKKKSHSRLDLVLVAGVPLVATGITITDLNGPTWIETFAATVMAIGGMIVALSHFVIASKHKDKLTALCWYMGGLCLLLGMVLAIAYGWRMYFPLAFLDIPWMYAVHGSLNFLGVGIFLLLGWHRIPRDLEE